MSIAPLGRRDRLTTLPPELFALVESFIYPSCTARTYPGPYLGAVSRAFLHTARKHHFTDVWIPDYDSFGKFVAAIVGSRETAVHPLNVSIHMEADIDDSQVPDEDLFALLSLLVSLRSLSVQYFPRFSKVVANPPLWCHPLPELESLNLADTFPKWRNPIDPRHWTSLDRYPALTEFHLSQERSNSEMEPHRAVETRFRPNSSITNLRIGGYQLGANPSMPAFIDLFSEAWSLTFTERSNLSRDVVTFLKSVPRPGRFLHLSIPKFPEWDPEFPAALARFEGVRGVRLPKGAWQHPQVTDVLLSLDLMVVQLADTPNVLELVRYVKNASALAHLAIDSTFKISRLGPSLPLDLEEQLVRRWTETFTPEGVIEVARIATEKGVRVVGDTLGRAEKIVEAKARRDEALRRVEAESRGS
ncbi:hypothetical protein JCM16303_003817 [Sporobolomyces ruberrimus]